MSGNIPNSGPQESVHSSPTTSVEGTVGAVNASADTTLAGEANIYDFLTEGFKFSDVLAWIDAHYDFTYTPFSVGELQNTDPKTTTGSCKVLAYAKLLGGGHISDKGVLDLFAEHYQNVLETPEGTNHANIRALMQHGMAKVTFHGTFPLTRKK